MAAVSFDNTACLSALAVNRTIRVESWAPQKEVKPPADGNFLSHAEIHTINVLYITTMNVKEQYYVLLFMKYIQMVRGI